MLWKHRYLEVGGMKMTTEIGEQIKELLEAEIDVVSKIYEVQKAIHEKVVDKDWDETKMRLLKINALVSEFSMLDKKLDSYVVNYGEQSLTTLVQSAEEDMRKNLASLCATLKRKLTLSKYENEAFNTYVTHSQNLARGIVDSLQEATSGSTYCYNGSRRRPVNCTGGLMLDQVL